MNLKQEVYNVLGQLKDYGELNNLVIDSIDATKGAFDALGLNADKMTSKFAEGGDKAQEAFAEVTKALMKIEDPVKRNEIGVQLFGTKFEGYLNQPIKEITTADLDIDFSDFR